MLLYEFIKLIYVPRKSFYIFIPISSFPFFKLKYYKLTNSIFETAFWWRKTKFYIYLIFMWIFSYTNVNVRGHLHKCRFFLIHFFFGLKHFRYFSPYSSDINENYWKMNVLIFSSKYLKFRWINRTNIVLPTYPILRFISRIYSRTQIENELHPQDRIIYFNSWWNSPNRFDLYFHGGSFFIEYACNLRRHLPQKHATISIFMPIRPFHAPHKHLRNIEDSWYPRRIFRMGVLKRTQSYLCSGKHFHFVCRYVISWRKLVDSYFLNLMHVRNRRYDSHIQYHI